MLATRRNKVGQGFHALLINAVRHLGGSVGVNYCCRDARGGGVQEVQTVFISCPREAWVGEFGEPQNIHQYFDVTGRKWFRNWEHHLPVGRVRCTGHFLERSPGFEWIIVKRLSVSRNREGLR